MGNQFFPVKPIAMSIREHVQSIMLIVLGAAWLGFTVVFSFFNFAPMSFWVVYYDVKPADAVVETGGDLYFISDLTVNRQCDLIFEDIIRCEVGDINAWYSSTTTHHSGIEPSRGRYESWWRYQHPIKKTGRCYLESNITLVLPWSIRKTQVVNSDGTNSFLVVEREG